jgi:hypothetical protein
MDKLLAHRIWGIPWSVLALVALGITIVYLIIDTSHGTSGLSWIILRWFHSLCWLFLTLAALSMSKITPLPVAWALPLAVTGGAIYAIFVITGLVTGTLFK